MNNEVMDKLNSELKNKKLIRTEYDHFGSELFMIFEDDNVALIRKENYDEFVIYLNGKKIN